MVRYEEDEDTARTAAMPIGDTDLLAESSFECSRCDRTAATVRVVVEPQGPAIVVEGFVSCATTRLAPRLARRLARVVSRANAKALFRRDPEYAPFFCPECSACYCNDHWLRWDVFDDDGWHDSIRGRCPTGHERMLED